MKKFLSLLLVLALALCLCACSATDYKKAQTLYDQGDYKGAAELFSQLNDYKDSASLRLKSLYKQAEQSFDEGDFAAAAQIYETLGDYKDSAELRLKSLYKQAVKIFEDGDFAAAAPIFEELGNYEDAQRYLSKIHAKEDPLAWLQQLIQERGELVEPSGGTPSYVLRIFDGISGPSILSYECNLRVFPSSGETRLEMSKMEGSTDTVLYTNYNMYPDGGVNMYIFLNTTPLLWLNTTLDYSSYMPGGAFQIDDYYDAFGAAQPNNELLTHMSDYIDSGLEILADFLEKEDAGITLADLGFTSYVIDSARYSRLMNNLTTNLDIIDH